MIEKRNMKNYFRKNSLNLAIAANLAVAIPFSANAIEPLFDIGIGATQYKTDDTKDGSAYTVRAGVLVETDQGQFHRFKYTRSIKTESEFNGLEIKDDKLEDVRYNIGKAWYPRNHASDYTMWTGLGHFALQNDMSVSNNLETVTLPDDWAGTGEITFTGPDVTTIDPADPTNPTVTPGPIFHSGAIAGLPGQTITVSTTDSLNRKMKMLYIPFGMEAGMPIFKSTNKYFVAGGEVKYIFNANLVTNDVAENKSGGIGTEFWLGFDFRFKNSILETRLATQSLKIDAGNDYKYQSNQFNITYRF